MKVYFVRHGESELNKGRIHQFDHTPLSQRGVHQAELLAKRLQDIPFDAIYASPLERTRHTTEIITQDMNMPIEFSLLLREGKRPSEFLGKAYDDPSLAAVKQKMEENFHNSDFRYKDGETYFDLLERAKNFTKILEQQDKEHVLCISHGAIIKMIVFFMIFQEETSSHVFKRIAERFSMTNTGVTVCEKRGKEWRVLTWNDTSHLP